MVSEIKISLKISKLTKIQSQNLKNPNYSYNNFGLDSSNISSDKIRLRIYNAQSTLRLITIELIIGGFIFRHYR